ncbi:MAG: SprT-like domain-containing protein [Gemmatimonadota bacterium]|jgi:hypothetical protein|nr:SprT-like domain-containing protein [Gemmatimonadota bacterium]
MGLWGPAASPETAEAVLRRRLDALGMPPFRGFATHTNRTVLLSVTAQGVLRVHRGYAWAPDRVLSAIVKYVRPGTRRATRRSAEREFLTFPVEVHAPPARPSRRGVERPRAGDEVVLARLAGAHRRLNDAHFGGGLPVIQFRLSGRMRTRLGELAVDARSGKPLEIAVSRAHLKHGWAEVEQTVLHEMVHQWQAESALPVDHGTVFRRKARAVGIEPSARRSLGHGGPRHTID